MKDVGWLLESIRQGGEANAIVWRDTPYTYRWFCKRVEELQVELDRHGVAPGHVIAIVGDFSPTACALLVALTLRRTIVVPLTSVSIGEQLEFLQIAQVQHVAWIDDDDLLKVEPRDGDVEHTLLLTMARHGSPGLVLFSSGSTGKNKAALHDLSALLEKFRVPRHTLRTITFLMFDHIGGVNTLFYILANRGTIVTVESREVEAVCATIERHRVELLPTSPSFLNLLLLSRVHERYDLSSLQRITYGTEVMPKRTLARLHDVFPNVKLMQTYGLTEVGILRAKSRGDDSLWVKVGGEGFETRVVDGILHIRAKSAMLGYLNAESPFDEDGWLNTGDAVEVDGEWLKILGRTSEVINVGGQKVYPGEVESVLLELDGISDVTVYGEPNALLGQVVVARVSPAGPESAASIRLRIREHCRDKLARFKIPRKIVVSNAAHHNYRFKKLRRAQPVARLDH